MSDNNETQSMEEKLRNARNAGVGKPTEETLRREAAEQAENENMQLGIRAGTELLVGLVAGGGIGYGLDMYFETKPFLFIAFLLLGVCSAFLNIYKITQKIGTGVGFAELHKHQKKGK